MKPIATLLALFITTTLYGTTSLYGQSIVDAWRYTTQQPPQGWQTPEFDASGWKEGNGGFGTRDTPGARVGTVWGTNDIWLRKSFSLKTIPTHPALLIHHDEQVEVSINGRRVAALNGFTVEYIIVPVAKEHRALLRTGENLMAVHCNQTGGGQFIDVHLIDADNIPELPKPKRGTKPFVSELITPWGGDVTAENAWREYPRPQLKRDNWSNLNGQWDYAITPVTQQQKPSKWDGKILVPYCLESKLGGVQRLLGAKEALWYRRSFSAQPAAGTRQHLNFEAVDYRCEVFVNGQSVGKHVGGHTPFSLDVTEALRAGQNEVIVRVEDETEGWQLRGKQVLEARGIWYTQVSGIWQTVWLEEVSDLHFGDLKVSTDADSGSINVRPLITGTGKVGVIVKDGETTVAQGESDGSNTVSLTIKNAKTVVARFSPPLHDRSHTVRPPG